MIALVGSIEEPMIPALLETLRQRGQSAQHLATDAMPGTIRFGMDLPGRGAFFVLSDGTRFDTAIVTAIYHRVGFTAFEMQPGYTASESRHAQSECHLALNAWLNTASARVVNRPDAMTSNASKPYQIHVIRSHGFDVPETLVTNQPKAVRDFYEARQGNVVYKSVSYLRSIVQTMRKEDLDRLDDVANCPVQVQEKVEGIDVRVHVVGHSLFASRIEAESSDYRYDKDVSIRAIELPSALADACLRLAQGLKLSLAGIDLRITGEGRTYCFEVNPSPAFTWYEAHTGQPITAALCDWLASAETVLAAGPP